MPVGPFTEDDWDDLLAPLHQLSISIDSSARQEIANWTGRVPELVALISIRSLVQRALRLIWDEELPGENTLPKDWVDGWKHATAPRCLADRRRIPSGDGRLIHARDLLTGKKVGHSFVIRKAVFLTKPSFHLLDSLQSMGDFGQHLSDYPDTSLSTGMVAAVVLSAAELVEALTQDPDSGS